MKKYYIISFLFSIGLLSTCFGPPPPTIPPLQPLPPPIPWEDVGIPELKKRLYSEDAEHRALAADRLVALGKKRTFNLLTEALQSDRDEVILSILKVLTLRQDERFIEPLIEVLETKDEKFQSLILEIFYNNPDRENLVAILLDRLYHLHKTQQPLAARKNIVQALGHIPSKNAVEPLIAFLPASSSGGSEDKDELSIEITQALKKITRQYLLTKEQWVQWWAANKDQPREVWLDQAINTYEKLLQDKDKKIVHLTSVAVSLKIEIINIRLEQAKKLEAMESVTSLLLTALDDEYAQVKKYALEQIRTLPRDTAKVAIPKLLQIMTGLPAAPSGRSEEIHNCIIITLGEIGDESVVDNLITYLNDSKASLMIRKNTVEALGKIASPRAVSPLCDVLKGNEPQILLPAIEALGKIKDKKSIDPLLKCLAAPDKTDEVRRAVIDVLGEIKDPACVEAIIKFTDNPLDRFRWSAANSLGKIGDTRAVEPLLKLLNDEFADIRQITAEALGNIGSKEAAPHLAKVLLNDEDPRARELTATALGKIKHTETIPNLLQSLSDTDEKVVNASWNALLSIVSPEPLLMEKTVNQLVEIKQLSRAVEIYRKIIASPEFKTKEMEPRLKSAQAKLGEILVNLKNFKEAIPLLQTARENFPDNIYYSNLLLQSYKELEQWDDALKIYNDQVAEQTKGSQPWWELKQAIVNLLVKKKDCTKAVEEIKQLLNEDSINPELKDKLEIIRQECEEALKKPSSE